jgi:hypothetical protein
MTLEQVEQEINKMLVDRIVKRKEIDFQRLCELQLLIAKLKEEANGKTAS